jgi:DNA-binding NarL/FixJ family response regulator
MMPTIKPKARRKHRDLSQRESEILSLLSHGLLYKEIADSLNISINTVRTHLVSIYRKLHVRSRTDAVVHFLRGQVRHHPNI